MTLLHFASQTTPLLNSRYTPSLPLLMTAHVLLICYLCTKVFIACTCDEHCRAMLPQTLPPACILPLYPVHNAAVTAFNVLPAECSMSHMYLQKFWSTLTAVSASIACAVPYSNPLPPKLQSCIGSASNIPSSPFQSIVNPKLSLVQMNPYSTLLHCAALCYVGVAPAALDSTCEASAHFEDSGAVQAVGEPDCRQLLSPQAHTLLSGGAAISSLASMWLLPCCCPGRSASKTSTPTFVFLQEAILISQPSVDNSCHQQSGSRRIC